MKWFKQLTELNKTAKTQKINNTNYGEEFKLFPDVGTIMDFIENEKYATISSISRQFKVHRMTASEIVDKLEKHGMVFIKKVGSAKVVKIMGE